MKFFDPILNSLKYIETIGAYPTTYVGGGLMVPETIINGKKRMVFCSNNYLGLSSSVEVMDAAIEAIRRYGTGAGGSRILSGNLDIHERLEEELARFKRKPAALVFSTGFQVGLGVIPALMNILTLKKKSNLVKQVIFSDASNHASLIDGCKLSKARIEIYRHRDVKHLEILLKRYDTIVRKLIVTDGVFSMDGDLAPMDEIVELAKKHHSAILLDDAHGTGTVGTTGRGVAELFGVEKDIDIIMGTFSKALGGVGGFVVGEKKVIKYLKIASRSYMFSAGLPASVAATVLAAIKIISKSPDLVRNLQCKAHYLRTELQRHGFNTLDSQSPIVPILIGEEKKSQVASRYLFNHGIYALSVRWPAVEKHMAIIRFTVMATHTIDQLRRLVNVCVRMKKHLKLQPN